jgi:GTP-binding protein
VKITSTRFEVSAFRPQDEPQDPGHEIVFLGRSNVGKSSLINRLLGVKKLARTSSTPGRTQSVNFYRINESFRFVDLPGYGYARVPESIRKAWGPMIEGALERRRERIVLALLVIDARHDPTRLDLVMETWLKAREIPYAVMATKVDKLSGNGRARAEKKLKAQFENGPVGPPQMVSAEKATGIRPLWGLLDKVLTQKR